MLTHDADRVLTQRASEAAAAMILPHGQELYLTVSPLQVDVPTDVGREVAVNGLRDRHVLALLWFMQFRDGAPVVVRPVAVLMLVDMGGTMVRKLCSKNGPKTSIVRSTRAGRSEGWDGRMCMVVGFLLEGCKSTAPATARTPASAALTEPLPQARVRPAAKHCTTGP